LETISWSELPTDLEASAQERRRPETSTRSRIDKADIERFLREKLEAEALSDAQIARLLNVGTSTVSHWRNKFNIKPADKFKRKFKEKYGLNAIEEFDMFVKNRATLQEIGNYFGFTRSYARAVYNKLYQGSYGEHQRQRRYR
jgi:transposase